MARHNGVPMTKLAQKLHPDCFTEMSPYMAAIVGYVLGEPLTDPAIAELTVSETEDLMYVSKAGGSGFAGLQSLTDSGSNWKRLLVCADGLRRPARGAE